MSSFKPEDFIDAGISSLGGDGTGPGGCASRAPRPAGNDTEAFASRLIADRVDIAAQAQRDYVAWVAEEKRDSQHRFESIDTDAIDVDYIGRPVELLRAFARRYGLRFVTLGHEDDLRVVNVRMGSTTPMEVIRNVSRQISPYAEVMVDRDDRVLRLVFKG
ncbi:DotD/TraH family lipoprotein [Tahibacter amnicola]|uniref:DotD/TraH family lipoprotein n=1 Tax=Tahibacter amnicola TaxID=2976241 RepID=A0ABY6BEQ4_9GAMM|nr:DotD/TraH family lipoprotein [Tahibacter amnicola]UXI68339.1 DotD/TraH family lipoprotein [Tahibacter amnicola]